MPGTLLIVEDSPTQAVALQALLESQGHRVLVAASGEEALDRLRGAPDVDTVLSDVLMPGIDGFELCRRIKADPALRQLPVVLLTTLADPLDIVRGLECGADNYITKPYDPERLLRRVERVRESRSRRRTRPAGDPVEMTFMGERFTITSDKAQILDLLISSFEELIGTNTALRRSEEERARQLEREQAARAEAERTTQRVRLLQAVTDAALADPKLDEFLATVLARLREALGTDSATILLREDREPVLTVRASVGLDERAGRAVRIPIGRGIAGRIAAGTAPEVVRDTHDEPDVLSALLRDQIRSIAGVPLRAHGATVGVLHVGAREPRDFTPEDVQLLRLVADRVALAIDRARLYESERAARLEAEHANRAKSEFLAVMSHELRTPLNAIAGYAELLEMGIRGPITGEQRGDLQRIRHNQRYLLGLVNDVLNFARLEAGQVPLQPADVPVDELLSGVHALVAPQLESKGLAYEYRPCDHALTIYADREKVQQILLNLLTNAIKFTDRGGQVALACAPAGAQVVIHVRDTGRGIPAEKLETIFDPFVQVSTRPARQQEGVGLGLAISRNLARAMGGELTAESVVGRGSTFTLSLPRTGDAARAAASAMPVDAHVRDEVSQGLS